MNILVDTNVLLDYLTKREPFFNNSEKIISMCACRKIRGYIANFKDIEDCLQAECAVDCIASYVVTRNIKDFSASIIPPITPDDFLRLYAV